MKFKMMTAALIGAGLLTACGGEPDTPGEALDEAIEETSDAMEDGTDDIADAVEDAADDIEDAVDQPQ